LFVESSAPAAPAIAVRHLTKRYGGRAVVDDLSFEIAPGEIFALLGPNGAGKTTTVEILEGYRRPDGGEVRVLGLDPSRDGRALKPRIGVMLQQGGVYPQIRPLEAIRLFASFFADPEDPEALLRLVGLEDSVKTRYRQLSGGQKQRLSLALALVGKPEVVFLDEPTAAMDPAARRATWGLIQDLQRRGVTVLLTTHFMEEAERLADRVGIINRGRLVALDAPERLARQSAAGEVRFAARPGLDVVALAARLGQMQNEKCKVQNEEASSSHYRPGIAAPAVREAEPGRYVVEAEPTPALLAALTGWMSEQGALLTELAVARHSLEEVYLRLTESAAPAAVPVGEESREAVAP
jgi:ABC-2 type transport system ATP-binding protein